MLSCVLPYFFDMKGKHMVKHWKRLLSCTLAAGMLLFAGCRDHGGSEDEPDPYAGMVEVPYGTEGTVWTKLQEGVPVSSFTAGQFEPDGQYIRYTGTDYTAVTGVDVSEHQRDIDWQQAADAGISFAMIRAGYRGSTAGSLYTDLYFFENMTGASAAGLDIGVYFFSQATTKAEAVAEAHYLLALLEDSGVAVTMPVVFDWEETGMEDARTTELTGDTITDCAAAFCRTITDAGYEAGVYLNRHMGYYSYDLTRLTDYMIWFAAPGEWPDFYYSHAMWQYTFTGQVPGIPADVDLDLYFTPAAAQTTE